MTLSVYESGTGTISASASTAGSIVSDTTLVQAGETITLTPSYGTGYGAVSVSVTGNTSGDVITVTDNTFTMPDEPVTVLATFTKMFTVTYNKDSGAIANESEYASYTYGIGLTLPTPTRDGYAFGGWYDNAGLTGTAVTAIGSGDTGNKTYWAKWSAIFSVTVPTSIAVEVDASGNVVASTALKIINNSYEPVEVAAVSATGNECWSIAAQSVNFNQVPVNTKQIKLSINGDAFPAGSTSNLTLGSGWTEIPAYAAGKTEAQYSLPLSCAADIPLQSDATSVHVADVVFMVGWAQAA